jgi:hypothetical protein
MKVVVEQIDRRWIGNTGPYLPRQIQMEQIAVAADSVPDHSFLGLVDLNLEKTPARLGAGLQYLRES